MQPEDRQKDRDAGYLWDMLDATQNIVQFTTGISVGEYLKDRKLQLAVERSLEIIGEAAKKVSLDFQQDNPGIPWNKIIAQRNVIAHEYGEIKQERIWTVVTLHIPGLMEKLDSMVQSFEENEIEPVI
ncbi:MAG: DUF86 domain-containing protein [Candidatus Aminicenantes bacterium]|nr:DUF86 domain-containing protein [Candidatus Aminicenantes bacterium]